MKSTVTSRRAKKSQKGAAMLETALVLLTLLSMIIFIMDMGAPAGF
jgi:Flp pilus assembly protein TadG